MKRILVTLTDDTYDRIEYASFSKHMTIRNYLKEIIEVMYKKKERKIAL